MNGQIIAPRVPWIVQMLLDSESQNLWFGLGSVKISGSVCSYASTRGITWIC